MNQSPAERQIGAFLAKYSEELAHQLRGARCLLREMFSQGRELVLDNYNALIFAFSPTERSADAFLSVAGFPKWDNLFFSRGVELDDPVGLLQGTGSRVRSIRLQAPEQISESAVQALIFHAMEPHREALMQAESLRTTIKSVSANQRSRRPDSTTKKVKNAR